MDVANITSYVEEEVSSNAGLLIIVVLLILWAIGCIMNRVSEIFTPIRCCLNCVRGACGACCK